MPPNFNEADVSDKPAAIRNLPLLDDGPDRRHPAQVPLRARVAALRGRGRQAGRSTRSRAKGELDNTLIVYTSDNGYFHGEHRIPTGKTHIYEESIRVPLEMRGPGHPAGGERRPDLAINADLAPTIVDAANATPGLVMDGRSLLPVPRIRGSSRDRELLIEEPSFEGDPDASATCTPSTARGEGALRPAEGPVRAPEPPRRPRLRVGQGPARGPPPPARDLRRSRAAACTARPPAP